MKNVVSKSFSRKMFLEFPGDTKPREGKEHEKQRRSFGCPDVASSSQTVFLGIIHQIQSFWNDSLGGVYEKRLSQFFRCHISSGNYRHACSGGHAVSGSPERRIHGVQEDVPHLPVDEIPVAGPESGGGSCGDRRGEGGAVYGLQTFSISQGGDNGVPRSGDIDGPIAVVREGCGKMARFGGPRWREIFAMKFGKDKRSADLRSGFRFLRRQRKALPQRRFCRRGF